MFVEISAHFLLRIMNCSDPVHSLVDNMDVLKFLSLLSLHFDIPS